MSNLKGVLRKSVIFNLLEDADLDRLVPMFQPWSLHTGDVLCTAGNLAQFFFVLEKGCLLCAMDRGRAVVFDTPGDLMAMELLSRKGVYTSTLTALDPGTVWVVARETFLELIQEDTEAAATIMAYWQDFLDETAPFARTLEDIDIPVMF